MSSRAKKKREWKIQQAIVKHLKDEWDKCKDSVYVTSTMVNLKDRFKSIEEACEYFKI